MHFSAHIKRGSTIHNHWRNLNKLSGILHGAEFMYERGTYRAGILTTAQVEAIRLVPSVQLEAMSTTPALTPPVPRVALVVPVPPKPPKPPSPPKQATRAAP